MALSSTSIPPNGIFSAQEESFLHPITRLIIDQDFGDSSLISVAESINMTRNVGHSTHQTVHLSRYAAIAKSIKYEDVAKLNTGSKKILGTNDKDLVGAPYTCSDSEAVDMLELLFLLAIRKNTFDGSAALPTDLLYDVAAVGGNPAVISNVSTKLSDERKKHRNYLLQTITSGVGPNWFNPVYSLDLGTFSYFKSSVDTQHNTFIFVTPIDEDWDTTDPTLVPISVKPSSVLEAATAIVDNNGLNALLSSDMPPGAVNAEVALMLATGRKKTDNLSTGATLVTKADLQKMLPLINKTSGGGVVFDLLNINATANSQIPKQSIGECAESDSRVADELRSKSIDDLLLYATDSPSFKRSYDLTNPSSTIILTYSALITILVRALSLKNATNADVAAYYKGVSLESPNIKNILNASLNTTLTIGSTSYTVSQGSAIQPGSLRAVYTSSGTGDTTKDKIYTSVYSAVTDARKTTDTSFADLNTAQKVADYLGGNNTESFLYATPSLTNQNGGGVNNGNNYFKAYLDNMNSSIKPSSSLDTIYDAFKILAAQNNKNMNKYTEVEDIIFAWFNSTVSPQVPTTTPATTVAAFWAVTPEQKAKRALANYIAIHAQSGWTLLSDPSNKSYFDLLIKLGKKSGPNVNPNQTYDLYAYDPNNLMVNDCPKRTKFGTGFQMYETIKDKSELSIVDKVRLYIVLTMGSNDVSGKMNNTDEITSLVERFSPDIVYNLPEMLVGRDNTTSLIQTLNSTTAATSFSNSSNLATSTQLYKGFVANTVAHQALVKRAGVFSTIMDIINENTSSNVRATFFKQILKYAQDYQTTFVKYISNFTAANTSLFKSVLTDHLSVRDFISFEKHITSDTYGADLKFVVKSFVSTTLNLSSKSLNAAVDSTSNDKLLPSTSYSLIEAARLALAIMTKELNLNDSTYIDTRVKLADFKGADGHQDIILIVLIAALKDGGSKIRLTSEGRQELLDASVLITDINNSVISEWGRLDFWTMAEKVIYKFISGANADGGFVSEAN